MEDKLSGGHPPGIHVRTLGTIALAFALAVCGLLLSAPDSGAQQSAGTTGGKPRAAPVSAPHDAPNLAAEIKALRAQISDLRRAMDSASPGSRRAKPPSGAMRAMTPEAGAMGSPPAMSMEEDDMAMTAPMPGAAGMPRMGTVPMESGAMGQAQMGPRSAMSQGAGMSMMGCCMGEMAGMGAGGAATSLPGFPGRSHLYHIGAEGFFLNHPQHITLALEQQQRLNQIREKALLEDATHTRRVEEAEQALFVLTGADQPDAPKIEAQLRAIAELRVQQRMAFIRSVGEAAAVLTDAQREALLGLAPGGMPKM